MVTLLSECFVFFLFRFFNILLKLIISILRVLLVFFFVFLFRRFRCYLKSYAETGCGKLLKTIQCRGKYLTIKTFWSPWNHFFSFFCRRLYFFFFLWMKSVKQLCDNVRFIFVAVVSIWFHWKMGHWLKLRISFLRDFSFFFLICCNWIECRVRKMWMHLKSWWFFFFLQMQCQLKRRSDSIRCIIRCDDDGLISKINSFFLFFFLFHFLFLFFINFNEQLV